MNPINLIMSFIMAKSRASFYGIPESQELTNTALLAGMVSENPMLSYIIIDNKAKNDSSNSTPKKVEIENSPDSLAANTETAPKGNDGKTPEKTETATEIKQVESSNVITIADIKGEIDNLTEKLTEITTKVDAIDGINTKVTDSVTKLNKILEAISKGAKIEVPIPNTDVLETPTKEPTKVPLKVPIKKNNGR